MKYHPHGSVLFITLSIEEGLLLLANPLSKAIIKSCLAQAQTLYPLTVCHYVVEATHLHLIAVVENPDDVKDFVRYFKTECAHMLNRVLGRRKRTIWCEGYDSPVVLTPLRTLIAISYLYANPGKDDLESSIDKYPGLSSWAMFRRAEHSRIWKGLRRTFIAKLAPDSRNLRGYTKEADRILAKPSDSYRFTISPNAWMNAFGITDPAEQTHWNKRIVERVRVIEERASHIRTIRRKSVMGKERLVQQKFNTNRQPSRSGKRMWCLSEDRELRISFVLFLKALRTKARAIRGRWILGDFSLPYPLGLYAPSMPKLAEPLSVW